MTMLYVRDGDQFREAAGRVILDRASAIISQRFRPGAPVMNAPARTREFLRFKLAAREHEVFAALFLDKRLRLIEYVELFRGTLDGASVHPREVIKEALARNASAVALCHVHPSGQSSPSQADEEVTLRLRDALALLDIRIVDHLIVGEDIFSMAEAGLI